VKVPRRPLTGDLVVCFCGRAGDGARAAGRVLARAAAGLGLHARHAAAYPAEIRGAGKTLAYTAITREPLRGPCERVDVLVALSDPLTIPELPRLNADGLVLYENNPPGYVAEDMAVAGYIAPGMFGYGVPFRDLAAQAESFGRGRNFVALGAVAALLDLPAAAFPPAIADHFTGQAETVRDAAVRSFEMGFEYARTRLVATHPWRALPAPGDKPAVTLVTGAAAIAAACAAAGVRLVAFYPVTPADRIRADLERLPAEERPVLALAADAAAAAAHAYGAVAAGRSSVAITVGSGLAAAGPLLDQAAAAGLPLVAVHVQTAGPAAALGTSTGQGDLLAAIHGLSDVQRPVLAPASTADCFDAVCLAVRLAARWRTPAVVLADFLQMERGETIDWPRPLPAAAAALAAATPAPDEAWAPPGTPGGERLVSAGGPDKRSGATEAVASCPIAVGLHRGRLNALAAGWAPPESFGGDGPLDLGLIAWGAAIEPAREALRAAAARGLRVGGCFPRLVWPLQRSALAAFAARCRVLGAAELNASGQLAGLLEHALARPVARLGRAGGEPLTESELLAGIEEALPPADAKGKRHE